ncbi:MAG TPA: Gfo/Idh/MocA family oxidoreductase [Dongiaceae bacterium]|nr:Gfo/Idh/MocA family oxidoreductase [Dongiaceae bacterium]
MGKVKVGIIGSGFQADVHCASFRIMPEEAEVVAIASPSPGRARALAERYGIARSFRDHREMLKERDIEMVAIAAPNHLHAALTRDAAAAGKHVLCEKPLCLTLEEAEEMIEACSKQGVLLMYGEELPFVPKYAKAKEMAREGAFGRIHLVKQSERHPGPHAPWFWDMARAGGGALMDMGCHGIAFCWWFLDRAPVRSVYCQMGTQLHGDRTKGEDNSLLILEFENGAIGLVENSWSHLAGMDDRIEVHGSSGMTYADLHRGNALATYSETGYGYAVEKAPGTRGWSFPIFDEHYNYGMPQELRHFARCVRGKEEPLFTGEDGRLVLEVMLAAYASAGQGRKVALPFRPRGVRRPVDLWRPA